MNQISDALALLTSRIASEFRAHSKIYLPWLIWFSAFALLVRATLGGPDGSRYMSYIRSLVFDHDLLLMNELEHFGQRIIVTSTGYSAQIANVGVIPFWLPFYLMGVLASWLGGDVGSGLASNYALWLDFGDWVYGLLALIVMYRWARTRFTRSVALAATLLVSFGSSFIYYMTALAPSYHTIAALLAALFFYLWDTTRARRTLMQWFGLGLLVGLLVSLAQYHAALFIFLIFDLGLLIAGLKIKNQQSTIENLPAIFIILLSAIVLPLLPQFIAWWIIFGEPLANPYTLESNWSGAHLLDVLFSSYHGLYFTAPILALATLGWLVAFRQDRALYAGALIALLGIAYSSATRIAWWAGVSFGARYFIGLTPLFVIGFAALLKSDTWQVARGRYQMVVRHLSQLFAVIGLLYALWTYGYFLQAFTYLTSFSEYHSPQQWIEGQFVVLRHLGDALTAHWLVPRSPALTTNLAGFALVSLLITRIAARWILAGRITGAWRWIAMLALVPAAFSAFLLTTIAPGEAHKQQFAAAGFYEKNLAREQFDFEQFSYEYVERARYDEALGHTDDARSDMARALALWPLKTRRLISESEIGQYQPLNWKFGEDIELLGYQMQDSEANGQNINSITCHVLSTSPVTCHFTIRLLWRTQARLPYDYDVGILLLDTRGQVLTRTPPTYGLDPLPTSWWLPGLLLSDEQTLDVSAVPAPSLLRVKVELFDASANKRLPITRDGQKHDGIIGEVKRAPDTTAPAAAPIATLGGKATLLAYQLTREAERALVRLTWRADAPISSDYTVFVHFLDAQNRMLSQVDAQPLGGRYPTHGWSPGEIISDEYAVPLPASAWGDLDHLAIGMYTLNDGARLPSSAGGDAILLKAQRMTP